MGWWGKGQGNEVVIIKDKLMTEEAEPESFPVPEILEEANLILNQSSAELSEEKQRDKLKRIASFMEICAPNDITLDSISEEDAIKT